jgi:aryl-alcohol dehydrogenase-like predicted oxidoreductase
METALQLQRRWQERVFDVTEGLARLAEAKGCSMAQLALAWCMHQPGVTSPIIGPRTVAQLQDNLGARDVVITDADRAAIDTLMGPGGMVSPFYEADFGPHPHRL